MHCVYEQYIYSINYGVLPLPFIYSPVNKIIGIIIRTTDHTCMTT